MLDTDAVLAVQKRLDDLPGATDYDTASVLRELNLAQVALGRQPVVKNRLFPRESTQLTVPGSGNTAEYDISALTNASFPVIERVLYDSTATSPIELIWMHPSDIQRNQVNQGATLRFFAVRGTTLYLAGIPATGDSGKTIKIWYNRTPETIDNSGTETTLLKACPDALIDKATAMLALNDDQLTGVADRYLSSYDKAKDEFLMSLEDGGVSYGQHQSDIWEE